MSWLSIFTKSDKAIDTGLDLVSRGADAVDALFYTDEEKAATSVERLKLKIKMGEGVHKFVEMTQNENSTRSVTRRAIAWAVIGLNILLTIYYVFVSSLAVVWLSRSEQLVWLADRVILALKYWGTATATIVVFYFGYYAASNVIGKWNETKTPSMPEITTIIEEDEKEEVKDNV